MSCLSISGVGACQRVCTTSRLGRWRAMMLIGRCFWLLQVAGTRLEHCRKRANLPCRTHCCCIPWRRSCLCQTKPWWSLSTAEPVGVSREIVLESVDCPLNEVFLLLRVVHFGWSCFRCLKWSWCFRQVLVVERQCLRCCCPVVLPRMLVAVASFFVLENFIDYNFLFAFVYKG